MPYISGTIHHMVFIYGTNVQKDIISKLCLDSFFHFFPNFNFVSWVKGQKITQNDKKSCLSHSMSQEAYIIWLWFLVYFCKMIISPDFFKIFSEWPKKMAKNGPKWQKSLSVALNISGTIHHLIVVYGTHA